MSAKQVAALPIKVTKRGKIKILLITSRETRRWIVPKGWPMDGKKPWRAAEIEALEEAGIKGDIARKKLGTFRYRKRLKNGTRLPCKVALFPMSVETEKKKWRERKERSRKWFSAKAAARAVDEPELKDLIRAIAKKPEIVAALITD